MSYKQHGQTNVFERQPDSELVYHLSGLIEGTISYKCEAATESQVFAMLGGEHPDDSNVTLYSVRVKRSKNQWWLATYDCIGLTQETTEKQIAFPNSVGVEPIETHKYFRSPGKMAGSPELNGAGAFQEAYNGAVFQMSEADSNGYRTELGFVGFVGANTPADLRGVRQYYAPNIMCNVSYYTRNTPTLKKPTSIQEPGVDIPTVEGVSLVWLHLISSAEKIGKADIWRVTEQYIAGTDKQISEAVYGD